MVYRMEHTTDAAKAKLVLLMNFYTAYTLCNNNDNITLDQWLGLLFDYSKIKFKKVKMLVRIAWPDIRFILKDEPRQYIAMTSMSKDSDEDCLKYVMSSYEKLEINRKRIEVEVLEMRHKALMERINKKENESLSSKT